MPDVELRSKPGPKPRPAESRFWPKVRKTTSCWLWEGCLDGHGYGQFNVGEGRRVGAHRFAYESVVGPVPVGMDLDHRHMCPKNCVNPDHLRQATRKENQENRPGCQANSSSGARGVYRHRDKWMVKVKHHGRQHYGGVFEAKEDAVLAAVQIRNALFTHNDVDRVAHV